LGAGEDQVAVGAEDSGELWGGGAGVDRRDQVEVVVGEGDGAGGAGLEGNPALGVEADPGAGAADRLLGAVDAAHPGLGELAGEEERRLALAALQHQCPLGDADMQRRGGQRGERRGRHLPDRRPWAPASAAAFPAVL
jgi:hypothetical protein